VLNLATNARDAMPDGGSVVISARAEVVLEPSDSTLAAGRYVCLSLRDTGEGMDEHTLASAGIRFYHQRPGQRHRAGAVDGARIH
jgi:signal transduction histidine kinase